MPALLFPDNSVICNYGIVEKISLLITFLNGRGRWTQAVEYEASRSARHYPDIDQLLSKNCFGESIEVDAAAQVEAIRRGQFGGTSDAPLQHMGEAETLYVVRNVTEYHGSTWITDDLAAFDFAAHIGITTWDTRRTIEQLIADYEITAKEGFDILNDMWAKGQTPRRMPDRWQDLIQ